ncbi:MULTISPECIES: stress protein [Bacillus]|uniref:stress protein n=1 Tax=Bacillus TaxID=1386 RepID=UPI000F7B9CA5|nr:MULTISPECIES: stress protein [Bacillus]MBR0579731.1 stress protein [Bacillus altitudinis A23-8]MDJ0288111.1 stress protein [Bacillus altitudinis]QDZ96408.1 stress protein [Bacillus altitudinis]
MKKTILSVALATAVSSTLPVFADAAEKTSSAPVSTTLQQTVLNKAAEEKATTKAGNVNINFDVLGIADALFNAANNYNNREGFVKGLMESAFYAAGEKYNVLVFNLANKYDNRLTGVKTFATANLNGVNFGIWVFQGGTFVNYGDGGYINWAYKGWLTRNGGTLNF